MIIFIKTPSKEVIARHDLIFSSVKSIQFDDDGNLTVVIKPANMEAK